jgi:hypothetical protein
VTAAFTVPKACIQRFIERTYCSRDIEPREFVFKDAARAIAFYTTSNAIEACPACIKVALASGVNPDEYLVTKTQGDYR